MTTLNDVCNATISLDAFVVEAEQRWGVGRLVQLVDEDTRLRLQSGYTRLRAAQVAADYRAQVDLTHKMLQAWRYMDTQATKAGHPHLSPLVWETRLPDGRVLAVVRSAAEAHHVVREGRDLVVWTLAEVANVAAKHDLLSIIKAEFPGALIGPASKGVRVEKYRTTGDAYAEGWVTQSPIHEMMEQDTHDLFAGAGA